MANAKEIQSRMKSIRDTMKITNAMYMIHLQNEKSKKKFLQIQSLIFTLCRLPLDVF